MKQIRKTLVCTALLLAAALTGCAENEPAPSISGQTNVPIAQQTDGSGLSSAMSIQPGTVIAEGSCGEKLTWTLDENGLLTISGSGEMEEYTASTTGNTPWKDSLKQIRAVRILDGVTSIGEGAFYYCDSLASVTIPDSVTRIGGYVFYHCVSLTDITIPGSVTEIGAGAFESCESLTSVTIPEGVTEIPRHAFEDCDSLTSVTIPDSVTEIGESAFEYCESLTSVTIPKGVTEIPAKAFYECKSLTSVALPDGVTKIGEKAFGWCESLTNVTIPDSVTQIGSSAFSYSALTSVTIPESVTRINDYAFAWCESLTSITIPKSVTSIGDSMFCGSTALIDIQVAPENLKYSSLNGVLYDKAQRELIAYPVGKADTSFVIPNSVTIIHNYAFDRCTSLTSITIPDSVTKIGYGSFDEGCDSLIIHAPAGSYAETYAKENNIPFQAQ